MVAQPPINSPPLRWTIADLELLPKDDRRYEIIDGELCATGMLDWHHQSLCGRIGATLDHWSVETGSGEAAITPGMIFTDADNVIPDVVWALSPRRGGTIPCPNPTFRRSHHDTTLTRICP